MANKISVLERDLTATQKRSSELEIRRETLHREHGAAVSERREQLLNGEVNSKALVEADNRVSRAESALFGIEDALLTVRNKISDLTTALAVQRDAEKREAQAKKLEAFIPGIEGGIAAISPEAMKLIAVLGECGVPEAKAAAMLLQDAWQQITREVEGKITPELRSQARILRSTPTPQPETFRPQPVLQPAPHRIGDVPAAARFTDWDEAKRLQR